MSCQEKTPAKLCEDGCLGAQFLLFFVELSNFPEEMEFWCRSGGNVVAILGNICLGIV